MPPITAHALVIGIAKYQHVTPLSKTTIDAREIHDTLLQTGYPPKEIALLLDEQATKGAISEKLDWLARRAGADDTVVIFFSGHGAQLIGGFWPGEYLCPVEAALGQVKDTLISTEEFTTALKPIKAGRLVVFLDACHAGGIGEPKDLSSQVKTGLSEVAYAQLAGGQGHVIIASCKPDEVSYELSDMKNGLFTHHLLRGLRGAAGRPDGTVWINDLYSYVYKQVSKDGLQHPYLKSSGEDFVISVYKSDSPIITPPPRTPSNLADQLASVDQIKLRKSILRAYTKPNFVILCNDLGLKYDELREGETLELKIMYLIDEFARRQEYKKLVQKVLSDHPYLVDELK